MILKSSYPIQLLILALGENSFAFPRKLRSLGELHSLTRKEKDITDENNDTTGSITGGGGGGEGGPNSLPPLPCIPSLMLSLQLYLTLEDSNSLISTPFPKLKFLKTIPFTAVLTIYQQPRCGSWYPPSNPWGFSCTLYVCYCLTCNAVPPTSVSPAMHSHC